ncbi:ribonuclease H-like domain-containing protein [Tanacetum coccineum]
MLQDPYLPQVHIATPPFGQSVQVQQAHPTHLIQSTPHAPMFGSHTIPGNYTYNPPTYFPTQVNMFPQAFHTITPQDLAWNMDTGALSHLADNIGKHVKLPFYSSASNVASVIEIIHSDLWTPLISSESGIKYYAIFLDHFSYFVWVYPLRKKANLFDAFVSFRAYVNNQFNVDIKALQCDHGDIGSLNYFLGIRAQRSTLSMFLSQAKFAEKILERAHMQNYNPCKTPVDTESKLGSDGDPVCLYMHDPRDPHFTALKCILRYVHVGFPVTRRSTSGYCVFLGDNLLSWSAKRQVTLSRSSAEAEYRGVANVVAKTAWICNLLRELHTPLFTATLVYCDNVSAVYMSANPIQHQRTKHIEIDIHFVHDFVLKERYGLNGVQLDSADSWMDLLPFTD